MAMMALNGLTEEKVASIINSLESVFLSVNSNFASKEEQMASVDLLDAIKLKKSSL